VGRDGLGDFGFYGCAEFLSQPVDGHFDRV
jgi:hypothetical protein